MATRKQTWALFCGTGLDVRGIPLSIGQASDLIDRLKNGETELVIRTLQEMGASGTPKIRKDFSPIWQEAVEAGHKAANEAIPTPMTVVEHSNPLNDNSPVRQTYHVPEGVCGFAWIRTKGNTSFGRWAKKHAGFRKSYPSGISFWVSEFGQSYERKMAFATAAAKVLKSHDIEAYAGGRLD